MTDAAVAAAVGAHAPPPRLCFHGTPRQWRDGSRPWIAEEAARSMQLFAAAGVPVARREYFGGEPPSLAMHFEVCDAFDLWLE